jgi:hypothetical protein
MRIHLHKAMIFHSHDPTIIKYMNTIFINSQFNLIKHIYYPYLHNVFISISDTKFTKLYNIPVEQYTVRFPSTYDFAKDLIIKDRNKKCTFEIDKPLILDVLNETNEIYGYYNQNIRIEYASIDDLRI